MNLCKKRYFFVNFEKMSTFVTPKNENARTRRSYDAITTVYTGGNVFHTAKKQLQSGFE